MTSMSSTSVAAQPLASGSLSADPFDAIVQAANPSHPNHAAWVEKFGGTLPRRTTSKIVAENNGSDHLEQVEGVYRRRRRGSSNTASRQAASQLRLDQQESVGFGKGHTRAHTSAVDGRSQRNDAEGSEQEEFPSFREGARSSGETARRKKKKKKGKGKERSLAAPIPPPRTTSQGLFQISTPEMTPLPAQPSPLSPSRSPRDPVSPRSPAYTSSIHSRQTSASLQANSSTHSFPRSMSEVVDTSANGSHLGSYPSRRRFNNQTKTSEPPARLSSMLTRAGELSEEQAMARRAMQSNSPTQTISSHTVSLSRNGSSRKSVDFALPDEASRRSLESHNIRKSFDVLVSPFRSVKKTNNKKGTTPATPSPPILKSPSMDFFQRSNPNSPAMLASYTSRPLSSVADEEDATSGAAESWKAAKAHSGLAEKRDAEVPMHPFAVSSPRVGRMRRDRTPSVNAFKGSSRSDVVEGEYLQGDSKVGPLGLGIATPGTDGEEVPQRRWRTRLTSFSGKSSKSPKVDEERKNETIDPPLPPISSKVMKKLIASNGDRDRNGQVSPHAVSPNMMNEGGSQAAAPMNNLAFPATMQGYIEVSPPTIHKTLSPALLTSKSHEADEIVSFIGSDRDSGLFHSLSNYEMPPKQGTEGMSSSQTMPISLHVTRPSTDVQPESAEFLETEVDAAALHRPRSLRRFSFGKPKLSTRASDGGLRKTNSPKLQQTPPPPLPSTPKRGLDIPPIEDDQRQSRLPRQSLDYRMPSLSRSRSRPSMAGFSNTMRGTSFTLDRESSTFYSSPKSPNATSQSPKFTKRFFSGGGRIKGKSKGISSSDFVEADQVNPARSDQSPQSNSLRGREGDEGDQNNYLRGSQDGISCSKDAPIKTLSNQMDNLVISSPTNQANNFQSDTFQQSTTTNDEEAAAAFAEMLRNSAKEDVALIKQIASRTAQAHSLQS